MDASKSSASPLSISTHRTALKGLIPDPRRLHPFGAWTLLVLSVLGFLRLSAGDFLVPVEGLADTVHDPRRNVLYLSSSTQGKVLRYDWATRQFLPPFEIGGKPGALDLTSDGNTLLVADMVQQGADEVLHKVDLTSGVDNPLRFARGPENGPGLFGVAEVMEGVAAIFSLRGNPMPAARWVSLADGSITPWDEAGILSGMALSGNRRALGLWTASGFRIYDTVTWSLTAGKRDDSEPQDIAVDATGSRFALVGNTILIYDQEPRLLARYIPPQSRTAQSAVFHSTRPLLFISYFFTNLIEVMDIRSRTVAASINYGGPPPLGKNPPQPRLRITPDGSRLLVPAPDGVRVVDFLTTEFSLRGATRYGASNRIMLAFSGPVAPATVSNLTQYVLEPPGTVLSASHSSNSPSLVTLQVQGTPERVRVSGVEGYLGDLLNGGAVASISSDPWMPSDTGTWVEGFQDGFDRVEMNPNWVAYAQVTGLGGLPVWQQTNGVLQVNPPSRTLNFPNFLLLQRQGYDPVRQEVLARVRWRGATSRVLMGVCASVNPTSPLISTVREGVSWKNAINSARFAASKSLLGPLDTRIITTNQWYWIRLRHDRSSTPGGTDVFGKVWRADGMEPEPEPWTSWDYFPNATNEEFRGYAGISGTLRNTLGDAFEVDYILIRAAGLPMIRVAPEGPAPRVESNSPSQSLPAGAELKLEVLASGDPPLRYQWRRQGVPLGGMTTNNVRWSSVSNAQSGAYDVVISNDRGSITSAPVRIEVVGTPVYSNTFETVPGTEWSEPRKIVTSTGIGVRYLGRYRGRMKLSVGNLTPGATALVTLNLVAYASWQGDSPEPNATGNWRVLQAGKTLYATSISLYAEIQSGATVLSAFNYSFQNYPDAPGGRVFPPLYGSIAHVGTAGEILQSGSLITPIREGAFPVRLLAIIPESGTLDLEFLNDSGIHDSSTLSINQLWGIDDLAIASVPPETAILRFTQRAVSATEAQSVATLTVERLGALQSHVSVRVIFEDQISLRAVDFAPEGLVLDFPAGIGRVDVPVRMMDNVLSDGTRYAVARLVEASPGSVIGDIQQTVLVIDDDETGVGLAARGGIAFESQGDIQVPLRAFGDRSVPQRVAVMTRDGTARAGLDYRAQTNRIILAPGVSQATASIQLRDDSLDEADEYFSVHVSGDSVARRLNPEPFEAWILDDDAPGYPGRGTDGRVTSLTRLNDESILVGGTFSVYNGREASAPTRLFANGTPDPVFPPPGLLWYGTFHPLQTPQGQLILSARLGGGGDLMKLDSDLVTRVPFATTSTTGVGVAAIDQEGRVYLGGAGFVLNGVLQRGIVRLRTDGSVDPTFSAASLAQGAIVQAILPLPEGGVLLGGSLSWSSVPEFTMLSRLKTDGSRDEDFVSQELVNPIRNLIPVNGGDFVVVESTALKLVSGDGGVRRTLPYPGESQGLLGVVYRQRDGKFLVVDRVSSLSGLQTRFYRLDTNFEIDPSFQHRFSGNAEINSIVETKDSLLLVGGQFDEYDHLARHNLVRLHQDGRDAGWPGEEPLPRITGAIQVPATTLGDPLELRVPFENATEFLWLHNGVPIPDQTGPVLRLASVTELDAGEYVVLARTGNLARWSEPVHVTFQPRPPAFVLETPRIEADGSFRLELQGENGVRYRVEVSTDLERWEAVDTFVGAGARVTLRINPSGAGQFVRAIREP